RFGEGRKGPVRDSLFQTIIVKLLFGEEPIGAVHGASIRQSVPDINLRSAADGAFLQQGYRSKIAGTDPSFSRLEGSIYGIYKTTMNCTDRFTPTAVKRKEENREKCRNRAKERANCF